MADALSCTSSRRKTTPAWRVWYDDLRAQVEAAIAAHAKKLESTLTSHSRLGPAVQYSLALPGKRFRPVLVLESCRVCGGDPGTAMPAAIALECVHTFSLIHDDLPAMDDDDLRRGQPSNHKVFGEAQAVLAGDYLAVHAFATLASEYPAEIASNLVQTLAWGTLGMIAGQGADVDGEQRATDPALVEFIHLHKTSRLIETACRLGALCAIATPDQLDGLACFGRHLGLAFQITDDLLDVTGNTETVGKQVGKDAAAAKQTYPAAFGVAQSRTRARQEIDVALAALVPFGAAADRLRDLATYVVTRDR
jgi:geranylgeranyl diphosphate synthase type II